MKHHLLVLLALPALAIAQHQHDAVPPASASREIPKAAAVTVPKAKDPDQREHWPGAVITPKAGESLDHASMHALPLGTGIQAKDGGWLRIDETGIYRLENFQLNEVRDDKGALVKTPVVARLVAGRVYRVMPSRSTKLKWRLPNATKATAVPPTALIPPMTVKSRAGLPYP